MSATICQKLAQGEPLSESDHREMGAASAQLDPDVQLMLRVRQGEGDAVAFEQLIAGYQTRLLRVLQHIVGSDAVAEDLVQEVFLRVWRARKNYQPAAKFSTWLFHIAHNVASNALRDRRRRKEYQIHSSTSESTASMSLEQMAMAASAGMPVRKLDLAERASIVRTAVEALSERQRMALLLCNFERLSYQEIAETMDLSVQAVKSLLSRARVNLKTLLQPYIDDGSSPLGDTSPSDSSNEAKP